MNQNLENIIGFKVRIVNLLDVTTVGKIYSINSSNNTITLQTGGNNGSSKYDFKIIKCSFIKSLTVVGEKPNNNNFRRQHLKPQLVHLDRVEQFLQEQVATAKKTRELHNSGVSKEGQQIFDLLYKTIPDTKWVGKDIVVLDDIKVVPPYKTSNIITLHESQSIGLIEKIVQKCWNTINEQRQVSSVENSDDGRKGG